MPQIRQTNSFIINYQQRFHHYNTPRTLSLPHALCFCRESDQELWYTTPF